MLPLKKKKIISFLAVSGLIASCEILRCSKWTLVVARGLSCSKACGILVPQPGIEVMSPVLQGRFLTTEPPGKSWKGCLSSEARGWAEVDCDFCLVHNLSDSSCADGSSFCVMSCLLERPPWQRTEGLWPPAQEEL